MRVTDSILCLFILCFLTFCAAGEESKEIPLDQIREVILHQSRYISSLEHDIGLLREEVKRLQNLLNIQQPNQDAELNPFATPLEHSKTEYFKYTSKKGEEEAQSIDSTDAWMYPQYIHIQCSSNVDVVMRPLGVHDRPNGECLDLNISGGDVSSRFVLYCNESNDDEDENGENEEQ